MTRNTCVVGPGALVLLGVRPGRDLYEQLTAACFHRARPRPPIRSSVVSQTALFGRDPESVDVGDPECPVEFRPGFLDSDDADDLLRTLRADVPWQQRRAVVYGERHPIPRLERWYGDPGAAYGYSGQQLERTDWHPALRALRDRLEVEVGERFNGVLANLYRSGDDRVGWHADDEPELGPAPVIASISLGDTRRFRIRHRDTLTTATVDLDHGSLLVMGGLTQRRCEHEIPRTAKPVGERINLTFRRII